MSAAWVQGGVSSTGNPVSSIALTFTNPIGNGDTVVGFIVTASSTAPTSITDDQGNNYNFTSYSGNEFQIFTLVGITNGPRTITVTWPSTVSAPQFIADEYSGIASAQQQTFQIINSPGTGADAISSGNVTTTEADLVWGAVGNYGGLLATVGTGETQRSTTGASGNFMVSEDKTQGAAGSVASTFTASSSGGSSTYYVALQTFKPSGTPPPVVGGISKFRSNWATLEVQMIGLPGASISAPILTEGLPFGTIAVSQTGGTAITSVQPQVSNDGANWVALGSALTTLPALRTAYASSFPAKYVQFVINGGDATSMVNINLVLTGTLS